MVVFLDMDGVICDFEGRIAQILGTEEYGRDEVVNIMRTVPDFFESLESFPGALAQVALIYKLVEGSVQILSAVPHSCPDLHEPVRQQKLKWLQKYLPYLEATANIIADKSLVGTEDDFLLDDHPEWSGADKFPGTLIHYKGPEDWETLRLAVLTRK